MWFGGIEISQFIVRRLVEHGHGFHPFGQPSHGDMTPIREAMTAAGRSLDELEIVGGLRPTFPDARQPADLGEAFKGVEWQLAAGYTTFCFNPSQYTATLDDVPALCRRAVEGLAAIS
jgi:hypothetical protein